MPHVKETIVPVTRPCARGSMPSCNANDVHLPHWLGSGHEWHINCLEMLAVFQALKHFLLDPRGHHVLVRTDNMLWSLTSTARGVCAHAPFTGWRARSFCGPRGNCSHWRQFTSMGTLIRKQTSCRDRGWGPGNRFYTPRWWCRFGRSSSEPCERLLHFEAAAVITAGAFILPGRYVISAGDVSRDSLGWITHVC